jgi:quinol-cytochrome oxidoreductase complex cytochrome b subunit
MATQQVKQPNARQRLMAWVAEVGRSFFPSMGMTDWRSVLRGEAAPRPNPRMRVHNNSFWYHIRPRALPEEATAWYYTVGLGWFSFYLFMVESITGLILMIFYVPSASEAYPSMVQIMTDVPLGNLMRNVHRLGAHLMVAIVTLHMMRTFLTASYKAPRQFIWVTGVILLLVTLILSFSGYLLPWDQLAYWAVTIGSSMADATPVLGDAVNKLLRGSVDVGGQTLLRFYLLHIFLLPGVAIALISVHYYAVRKQEISPIHELFDNMPPTRRKVPFLPDQVYFEIAAIAFLTFGLIAINQFFWNATLEGHANAFVTPQHTKAPWYFLFLQGMLKVGDKFFFGLLLFGVMFAALMILPYIDRNPSRKFKDRKVALSGFVVAVVLFGFLTYAGLPFYGIQETATSELVFEWVPGEGEGKVDHVPFNLLPGSSCTVDSFTGTYIGCDEASLSPEAKAMFEEFLEDVKHWKELDRSFAEQGGDATLTVAPWQLNQQGEITLQKVTLLITVDGKLQTPAVRFVSRYKDNVSQ